MTFVIALAPSPGAEGDDLAAGPVQPAAGMPEGCLLALVSTGAEAIERDGKVVNTNK